MGLRGGGRVHSVALLSLIPRMEEVEAAIQRALHTHDYNTAIWLCEQAHAATVDPSGRLADHPLSLTLATCYYRSGKPHRAYAVLKGCTKPEHKFLFALAW